MAAGNAAVSASRMKGSGYCMCLLLPLQAKSSITAQLALLPMVKTGPGTHWPGRPSAFPREASTAAQPMSSSIPLCQAWERGGSVHSVQPQEMAVLLQVGVCETDTFFAFFSLFWGFSFYSFLPPFPGPLPRKILVPFSPTKGTKSFFYWPTGCSGYKEVKLTMLRCNSPLQTGLDESQK